MRRALPLLLLAALLAGCAGGAPEVPPSVSYRVPGNNVAITAEEAQNYCVQFDRAARYQGLQQTPAGMVAVYTCDGAPAAAQQQ